MSKYTTGEMAKLCNVSVRTVQYYDNRRLLVPTSLTDGGRRLYSEDDLKKLKIICFLRGIGLSIDTIAKFLAEDNSREVIAILMQEQAKQLKNEIADREARLHTIKQLMHEIKSCESFSPETINDIAFIMEQQKKLYRLRVIMVIVGIFMDIIEIGALAIWITKGIWWPFAVGIPIVILCGVILVKLCYQKLVYICPECHEVFKPGFWEFFFANHTPKTRKLTCIKCGHKGFCVETYYMDENNK